jgi:triosephosphate isomerase
MDKKIYLFANWKMYLDAAESVALASTLKNLKQPSNVVTAVFPSALAVTGVIEELSGSTIAVGAQNVYFVDKGGVTGEISAAMFAAAGCAYALVGHSERRHLFGETNHEVRQKLEAVLMTKLIPVLCVGETLKERENGQTEEVIETQLRAALTNLVWPDDRELIIAYEPVWAISKGTESPGLPCEPAEAEKMHVIAAAFVSALQPRLTPVILFGGSVRPHTVLSYVNEPHIDGALVGAASTKFESWLEIVQAV